jgi:hypothetical protein
MGHVLDAIVARSPINEERAIQIGLALIYEKEYVILPTPYDLWSALSGIGWKSGDDIFNLDTPHVLAKELGMTNYVLIRTDYDGGRGYQEASYHAADGRELKNIMINMALRELGVERIPRRRKVVAVSPWIFFERWWRKLIGQPGYFQVVIDPNWDCDVDEFDMINLGKHRISESPEYWDDAKAGQRIGNVVMGWRSLWDEDARLECSDPNAPWRTNAPLR